MSDHQIRIAVYGELNMNLIDGSSIWLQSVSSMLASLPGVEVTILLRAADERDVLTGPLRAHPSIHLEPPPDPRRLTKPDEAVARLEELDSHLHFDHVLLRGSAVTDAAIASGRLAGRLWVYYIPPHGAPAGSDHEDLERRGDAADRILCQTEWIRARVEAAIPQHGSKLVLLPPMIPPLDDAVERLQPPTGAIKRLFYGGKFSPEYFFLEMVELFRQLHAEDPELEFHIAGDKIHNPPDDPAFKPAAERALETTPGLVWHGAVSRERVRELTADCDLALSIRHPSMDSSTELSTKILEYGAAGAPVLLNRNPVHTGLLGTDYPLLCSGLDDALSVIRDVSEHPELRALAQQRCHEASLRHTFDRVAAGIAPHVRRRRSLASADEGSPQLLVAGHALNFFDPILRHALDAGAAVCEDVWAKHVVHDEEASTAHLQWAETIMCEWCLGNAIFYSHGKRPGQRLVVRFHRMEIETDHPAKVELDKVDDIVFVAQHVMDQACEKYGWTPDERFHLIPNSIDVHGLGRPKLPDAQFTLGMIGFVPMLKRVDRALDILERVRAIDDRYRLVVKGRPPWSYYWMFTRDAERTFYERVYDRLQRSPLLEGAVSFEPFGPDIGAFLQKVGFMMSLSDIEGHPVALAEGMASGAVPVVFDRPGAGAQYEPEWVHATTDEAALAILRVGREGWGEESTRVREYAGQWSWETLAPRWEELLGLHVSAGVNGR